MVDNADKAIAMTCLRTGAKVKEYTAAPLLCWIRRKDGTNGLSSLTRNRNLSMNSPLY